MREITKDYEMAEAKKTGGGLWISEEIFNSNLSNTEKIFLALISNLSSLDECFASNEYFSKKLNLSASRCSQIISSFEKKGIISRELHYGKNGQIEKRTIFLTDEGVLCFSGEGTLFSKGGYFENCEDNKYSYIKEYNKYNNKTTTNNNIEYIYENSENSGSPYEGIFQLLKISNLNEVTIKNILKLVREKNIPTVRVEAVITHAQEKNWNDGAIYEALKEDWTLKHTSKENFSVSRKKSSKENDEKIQREYMEGKKNMEETRDLINNHRELFDNLFDQNFKISNNKFSARYMALVELRKIVGVPEFHKKI